VFTKPSTEPNPEPVSNVHIFRAYVHHPPPPHTRGGRLEKVTQRGLHNLYSSADNVRVIKPRTTWAGYVERMGEMRNVYKNFVGKPDRKKEDIWKT
jgi:hypothetical protein